MLNANLPNQKKSTLCKMHFGSMTAVPIKTGSLSKSVKGSKFLFKTINEYEKI